MKNVLIKGKSRNSKDTGRRNTKKVIFRCSVNGCPEKPEFLTKYDLDLHHKCAIHCNYASFSLFSFFSLVPRSSTHPTLSSFYLSRVAASARMPVEENKLEMVACDKCSYKEKTPEFKLHWEAKHKEGDQQCDAKDCPPPRPTFKTKYAWTSTIKLNARAGWALAVFAAIGFPLLKISESMKTKTKQGCNAHLTPTFMSLSLR